MQPLVLAEPDPAVSSGRPAECLTELVGERLADRIAIGQPVPRNEPVREPERFLTGRTPAAAHQARGPAYQ